MILFLLLSDTLPLPPLPPLPPLVFLQEKLGVADPESFRLDKCVVCNRDITKGDFALEHQLFKKAGKVIIRSLLPRHLHDERYGKVEPANQSSAINPLPIAFAQLPSVPRLFERWNADGTLTGGNTPFDTPARKRGRL